jgi:polar amino acid transport system substrate-binding protein
MIASALSTRRAALAAAFAATLLAACGKKETPAPAPTPAPAAQAPAPAPTPKVYTVGTDAAYAPFESMSSDGKVQGFTVDVLTAVAAKGGFEVKFVNTPWEGIFKTLDSGERDIVASSVTITDERKQTMDFSAPYFDAQQLIAVKDNSSANTKRFESTPLALKELEAGGVAAVVADNGVVQHYIANNPAAKFKAISDTSFAPEQYGFAVKKGNAELIAKINKGVEAIKADGSYNTIYGKYFGEKKDAAAPAAAASAPAAAASK